MRIETAVALAIFAHIEHKEPELGSSYKILSEDILPHIRKLKDAGIETHIRIRPCPNGAYSEEVNTFLGRLSMGGYAPNRYFGPEAISLLRTLIWRSIKDKASETLFAFQKLGISNDYLITAIMVPAVEDALKSAEA